MAPDEIYSVDCDIFSPCALGAVLNEQTLPQLKASIVVGSANNQLVDIEFAEKVVQSGIHYIPDYVVSSGGLIYAAGRYNKVSDAQVEKKIDQIYDTLTAIFQRSAKESRSNLDIADAMAEEKL